VAVHLLVRRRRHLGPQTQALARIS
jgi:hypothetical protein